MDDRLKRRLERKKTSFDERAGGDFRYRFGILGTKEEGLRK